MSRLLLAGLTHGTGNCRPLAVSRFVINSGAYEAFTMPNSRTMGLKSLESSFTDSAVSFCPSSADTITVFNPDDGSVETIDCSQLSEKIGSGNDDAGAAPNAALATTVLALLATVVIAVLL